MTDEQRISKKQTACGWMEYCYNIHVDDYFCIEYQNAPGSLSVHDDGLKRSGLGTVHGTREDAFALFRNAPQHTPYLVDPPPPLTLTRTRVPRLTAAWPPTSTALQAGVGPMPRPPCVLFASASRSGARARVTMLTAAHGSLAIR